VGVKAVYAIIQESGKQYKIEQGDVILVDKKNLEQGNEINFDRVLYVDGKIGTPYVEGAKVVGVVKENVLGEKIRVQKFKRRKGYRRVIGHRQRYTKVEIKTIEV
jgi:large subunit ribosomal protein L21